MADKPIEYPLGQNIQAKIVGDILTLTIDLSKELGKSKSEKNMLIASCGNAALPNGAKLGLNVYKAVKS
jgi:hypothetical protein